jgi:hypothetical protein
MKMQGAWAWALWSVGMASTGLLGCSDAVGGAPMFEDGEALIAGAPYPTKSLAFVMVDIGGGVNVTQQQAMNRLVSDSNSIRNLLLYSSYGRQDITVQTFGPFSYSLGNCNTSGIPTQFRSLVNQAGGQVFQHYLWYLGSRSSSCGWSSLGEVGRPDSPANDSWYNATTSCLALGDGLFHNFGSQHSSAIRCPGVPLADIPSGPCINHEFGDPFDVIGGGCRHPNAWQKTHQGWLGACNGVTVKSSGTFMLLPYERRCDGPQFLKLAMPKTRLFQREGGSGGSTIDTLTHYYVELRTPLDFDGTLGGSALTPRILIHVGGDTRTRSNPGLHTFLLDMTPGTTTFADAALAQGQTFTDPDPAGGLSITAQAVSSTQATIVVQSNGSGAPTCLDGSTFTPPGPGPEACVDNPAVPVP